MDCVFSIYFKSALCSLLAITSLVSFIQNVFYCYIVWLNKSLHKKSQILVVSLSISGIINSLTVPTLEFTYVYYHPRWPIGAFGTDFQNSIWLFSLVLPFATVTCITIERYLATVRSAFYRAHVTRTVMAVIVCGVWTYSITWTCIIVFNFTPPNPDHYVWNVPATIYNIFLGVHLIVPLFIIPFLYWLILKTTRESRADVAMLGQSSASDHELRLAKTVAMVVICLYLVWLPVVGLEIVYNFDFSDCIVEQAGTVSVWITSLNGCLYPLIYSYRIKESRQTLREFREWLKNRCCCSKPYELLEATEDNHPYQQISNQEKM